MKNNNNFLLLPILIFTLSIAGCDNNSNSSEEPVQYTVTFKNYDESVLATITVNEGTKAVYDGPTPTKPSTAQYTYYFAGWDKNLTNVSSSFSTIAQYSKSLTTFTITWKNYDGTVLETDSNVPYGTTPIYNGAIPTKAGDADCNYYFSSWLPTITTVIDDATYTAQYTQELNYVPITIAQELSNIRGNLSGNYRLMNDIDLESVEWTPIGTNTAPFSGTFNGQGFSINNLKITLPQRYVGLFGYNMGSIKNVKLQHVNINVNGEISVDVYGGAFIGYNSTADSNVQNLHALSGNLYIRKRGESKGYAGGIIGYQETSVMIDNVSSGINVTGDLIDATGGLIGAGAEIYSIANSSNDGSVTGISSVGGLIGRLVSRDLAIANSFNSGTINGSEFVGGLIGNLYGWYPDFSIDHSSNSGTISGLSSVGGLLGYVYYETITITDSNNSGIVNGTSSNVGGFIGYGEKTNSIYVVRNVTINNSHNDGGISGKDFVGGLLGKGYGVISISNSHNSSSVTGTLLRVGGLVGYADFTTTISKSYNSGSISSDSGYVGGLVGLAHNTISITDSYNCGVVSGTSEIGGLIGDGFGNGTITISNCFNSGSIIGVSQYIGGLIGYPYKTTYIYCCVNWGDVASLSSWACGGILGSLPASRDIDKTYYSGVVTYNGGEVDGTAFGTKVTDLSTFNLEFFTTTLGWSTDIWAFTGLDVVNGVYPTLIISTIPV